MIPVLIDFETRSRLALQISRKKKEIPEDLYQPGQSGTNAYKYAGHESTEVLCMGYQVGCWPRELWRPGEPSPLDDVWDDCVVQAFNAEFEYAIWNLCAARKYGWPRLPANKVECLQARAAYAGLPRKLDNLGAPLGLGHCSKDKEGHRVMQSLCKPKKAKLVSCEYIGGEFDETPARHRRNEEYCLNDIRAEGFVARLCPPLLPFELEVWRANHEINMRGVPIDRDFCEAAVALVNLENRLLGKRLQELVGNSDMTPDDIPLLKIWMQDYGVINSTWPRSEKTNEPVLNADVVKAALKGEYGELPAPVREVLTIRQLTGNSSVAKYSSMLAHANERNLCQGGHAYYEAGPGRFAGRGPQFQNLPRLDKDTLDDRIALADRITSMRVEELEDTRVFLQENYDIGVIPLLAGMVRLAVKAESGRVLVVSDWSAIEMRVLHWLAGDARALQEIRDFDDGKGADPYKINAATMYGKQVSDITGAERQQGKVMRLGCGYCTGATKFQAYCEDYDIDMPREKAQEIVQLYRRTYPLVKRFWGDLNNAAVKAITEGGRHQVGYITYYMTGSTLNARLPSGREIKYYDAGVVDGRYGPEVEALSPVNGGRRLVKTPTLVENGDQGVSRDILAEALVKCRAANLPVVLHVHDEIVLESPEKKADEHLRALTDIMLDVPQWARGLPLATSGGYHERYIK